MSMDLLARVLHTGFAAQSDREQCLNDAGTKLLHHAAQHCERVVVMCQDGPELGADWHEALSVNKWMWGKQEEVCTA